MSIQLEEDVTSTPRPPVLKHRIIGEKFSGMLIGTPVMREVIKDDKPVPHPTRPGKFKQELVVTMIALPGTTMEAALGGERGTPAPGDLVRMICRGRTFGDWIEAYKSLGAKHVGDIIMANTTHGQAYDANGKPTGPELKTQAECDAVPREQSLGFYGDLTVMRCDPANATHAQWLAKAEAAYRDAQTPTVLEAAAPDPFGDAVAPAPDPFA